jgi:hypothetical protein
MRQTKELFDAAVEAMECENWPLVIEKVTEAGKQMVRVLKDLTVDENPAIRKRAAGALEVIIKEANAAGVASAPRSSR